MQLSLYRALFSYEFRKHSDELRHFMLLYSKYSEGLVSIANLPELTLRAIRMRNLLTWCDTTQTSNGLRVLEKLTPEMLNRKGATGRLWDEWTRPELDRLLSPIHEASPLERAYYFRFMEFVEREHLLSKVGNKTKDDSGFAAILAGHIGGQAGGWQHLRGTDHQLVRTEQGRHGGEHLAELRKGAVG